MTDQFDIFHLLDTAEQNYRRTHNLPMTLQEAWDLYNKGLDIPRSFVEYAELITGGSIEKYVSDMSTEELPYLQEILGGLMRRLADKSSDIRAERYAVTLKVACEKKSPCRNLLAIVNERYSVRGQNRDLVIHLGDDNFGHIKDRFVFCGKGKYRCVEDGTVYEYRAEWCDYGAGMAGGDLRVIPANAV